MKRDTIIDRQKVRPSSAAGVFYPAEKSVLSRDLSVLLENAPVEKVPRPIRGMVVPYAGYVYSGGVAARAYRQILQREYEVIVVIGSSATERFDCISIYSGSAFDTPLGPIPVHKHLAYKLSAAHPDIQLTESGFDLAEHAIEVQMPFLTYVQKHAEVLPIMMGSETLYTMEILKDGLISVLNGRNFLVVACSELSHGYSDSQARRLDNKALNAIEKFSAEELHAGIIDNDCEMRGVGPALVTMRVSAHFNARESRILLYRTSGEVTGNRDKVVGFVSAIFY